MTQPPDWDRPDTELDQDLPPSLESAENALVPGREAHPTGEDVVPPAAVAPEGELPTADADERPSTAPDSGGEPLFRAPPPPPGEAPPPVGAQAPAAAAGRNEPASAAWELPVIGAMTVVLLAIVAGLVAYLQQDEDTEYSVNRGDDEYDLPSMALRNADMPQGLVLARRIEFDNEQWAVLTDEEDPEGRQNQLEAQERIRNSVSYFTWPGATTTEHLGEVLSITSQSTLFETPDAAEEETSRLCGLLIDERDPLVEFAVPSLGDESVGFYVTTVQEGVGTSIDTVVCFRTGRIVHGVVQTGLKGTEDIGLSVTLAERMLDRVDQTFEGEAAPLDDEDLPAQEG